MPVLTSSLSTTDPDVAHEAMNATVFTPERPIEYSGSAEHLECSFAFLQVGDVHAGRLRHTMRTHAVTAPFEEFTTATFLDGAMSWDSGGEQVRHRRGDVGRYPNSTGLVGDWSAFEFALLRIPMAAVAQVAHAQSGIAPTAFAFHGLTPVDEAATAHWRHLHGYVLRVLEAGSPSLDSPLVQRGLIDYVAATALMVFPNRATTSGYQPGPGWVGSAALQRAVAYVDTHAREAITLGDIAAAAGTTGRAVQAAFQRHLNTTPLSYLRRVRLEGAHRDLQTADPAAGATVTTIAAAWGFGHAARFSQFYRQHYGVPPHQTLRT